VVEYFEAHDKVTHIDGRGTTEDVFLRLNKPVKESWRKAR
jgi:hypothetical protein